MKRSNPEYIIPLSSATSIPCSQGDLDRFFTKLSNIPDEYLMDIVYDLNDDYKIHERVSGELLSDYVSNRKSRSDAYFVAVREIRLRLVLGKSFIKRIA